MPFGMLGWTQAEVRYCYFIIELTSLPSYTCWGSRVEQEFPPAKENELWLTFDMAFAPNLAYQFINCHNLLCFNLCIMHYVFKAVS